MKKISYDPNNLSDFNREWLTHKKCREWWYATGILFDQEQNMYSYQYTMLSLCFGPATLRSGMIALTDYKNKRHYYLQDPSFLPGKAVINQKEASYKGVCTCVKKEKEIEIHLQHSAFDLQLHADYGKGAFWHCDNGKLQMGIPGEQETTLYYSYTNMPTTAILTLNGKKIPLTGKTWFDRQGGTYNITNYQTHWEWFSLRFFDDEEMMLFTFPQDDYYDGTYITKNGQRSRLNDYKLTCTNTTVFNDLTWGSGWRLETSHKEKEYTIEPIQEGHINFAYFEELCYIKNQAGEIVGYAFAELLPGVRNDLKSLAHANLFKRVEI